MKAASLIAVYVVIGFLTFGYYFNRHEHDCEKETDPSRKAVCSLGNGANTGFVGILWPVYWAARGALEVTK